MNKYNAQKLFHTLKDIFISSPYGYREAIYKDGKLISKAGGHEGVDYSANGNSIPIYALDEGIVLYEGYDNSTGAIICYIRYPKLDDHVGLYYHLACTYINKGDKVTSNTKIGMMGSTGNSTGNHLHFNWFPYADYSKGFYNRDYQNFDNYSFKLGTPVNRNEDVDQIEILGTVVNVRDNANGERLGYINKGIYNVISKELNGNYNWYHVENGLWIAYSDDWAKIYDKKVEIIEEPKVEQPIIETPVDEPVVVEPEPIIEEPTPTEQPTVEEPIIIEVPKEEPIVNKNWLNTLIDFIINLIKEIFKR